VRFWTTTHAVFENGMGGKKVAWVVKNYQEMDL
jgi:hypothetical protein